MSRRLKMLFIAAVLAITTPVVLGSALWIGGSILTEPATARIASYAFDLPHVDITFPSQSGSLIHGWFLPSTTNRGTVILMHGVRANRLDMVSRARFLRDAGYSVFLFDFQAHGESPGKKITFGYLESRDAQAAVNFLRKHDPDSPISVIGVSLGGAAAVLGSEPLAVQAIVLEAVYPSIDIAISNRLQIRLGELGRLLTFLFTMQLESRLGVHEADLAPIQGITRVTAPLLIVAGANDQHTTLVDSRNLYAAAPEPKMLWIIPGAAHVDFHAFRPQDYERKMLAFLGQHATTRQQ